jgi:valyl-tRNA synthetase
MIAVVGTVRSTRARYQLSPNQTLSVVVRTTGENAKETALSLEALKERVSLLGNISLLVSADAAQPANASITVVNELEVFVELEGLVDFAHERERLVKEQTKLTADREKLEKKLSNEGFLAKAAPEIIEKTRMDAAELADALERLALQLASLPQA